MVDTNKLRGLAVAKFGSIQKMADHLHWDYQKLRRIMSGTQDPKNREISQMASALGITDDAEIVSIFSLKGERGDD